MRLRKIEYDRMSSEFSMIWNFSVDLQFPLKLSNKCNMANSFLFFFVNSNGKFQFFKETNDEKIIFTVQNLEVKKLSINL